MRSALTTIGAGAVTYIVGPVTGAALGASSEVMALSIAAGLVKAILVMVLTPFVAPYIGLNNPRTAVIFGGLMGTSSGVAGGLAATDPKLVPYGLPDRGVLYRHRLPAGAVAAVFQRARPGWVSGLVRAPSP